MSWGRSGARRTLSALLLVVAGLLVTVPVAQALIETKSAVDVAATAGTPFSGPVATFNELNAPPHAADFSATVDWGDGTAPDTGVAAIELGPGQGTMDTVYRIDGSHTYVNAGIFPTTITITEVEAIEPVIVNGVATVAAPPVEPPAPPPPPPPAPPPPPVAPSILSAAFSPLPTVGRPTVLRIRASSPNAPVGGYEVNLGEAGGRFGAIACSDLPPLAGDPPSPFLPGTVTTFGLGYTFRSRGSHAVSLLVASGLCTADTSTQQRLTVNVGAATTRAAAPVRRIGLLATAAQSAGCSDDLDVPDASNAAIVAAAAVCLVNAERAAAGLPALGVDTRLIASATAHTRTMIDGRFFQHQGPGEPELGARGAAAGYRAGMGENIGFGSGSLSTAAAMVDAWMNSPPHRANILDPRYRGIGMAVVANAPTGAPTPGATYTTNFGTDEPGTPPPAVKAPAPAVKVTLSPRAFRAAAAGPSTAPAGTGMRIAYTLTRAANVVFTVERKQAGRRAAKRCVAPKPSNRRARPCSRTRRIGAFREQGKPGPNDLRFRGRIAGRRLAPGNYQLRVVATDAAGVVSQPRVVSFRILRGRA